MCYTEFCLRESKVIRDRDGTVKTLILRSGAEDLKHLPLSEFRKATGFDMKMVKEEEDAITATGDAWVQKHGIQLSGEAKERPLRFYVRAILRGLIPVRAGWAAERLGDACADDAASSQICEELRLRTEETEARAMAYAQQAAELKSKLECMQEIHFQLQQKLVMIEALHEHEVTWITGMSVLMSHFASGVVFSVHCLCVLMMQNTDIILIRFQVRFVLQSTLSAAEYIITRVAGIMVGLRTLRRTYLRGS